MNVPDWAMPFALAIPGFVVSAVVIRRMARDKLKAVSDAVSEAHISATKAVICAAFLSREGSQDSLAVTISFDGPAPSGNWSPDKIEVFIGDSDRRWQSELKPTAAASWSMRCKVDAEAAARMRKQGTYFPLYVQSHRITVVGMARAFPLASPFYVTVSPLQSVPQQIADAIPSFTEDVPETE